MTPERRTWITRVTAQWAARAAELRADPGAGAQTRAAGVEGWVERLTAELAAEPEPAPNEAAAAELQRRLDRLEPYADPRTGVIINDWPPLERIRHQLRVEIAALLGRPVPTTPELSPEPRRAAPIVFAPIAEAVPFTAGPQLDLLALLGGAEAVAA